MPGKCHFQDTWLLDKDFQAWLGKGSNNEMAYCQFCMRDFSVSSRGIGALRQHASGKAHLAEVKAIPKQSGPLHSFFKPSCSSAGEKLSPSQSNHDERFDKNIPASSSQATSMSSVSSSLPVPRISSQSTQPLILPPKNLRDDISRAEILFALKMVSSNSSFNSADQLTELVASAFPDSDIAKNFTLNPSKAAYVINYGLGHTLGGKSLKF